jgi:hypothetical protein
VAVPRPARPPRRQLLLHQPVQPGTGAEPVEQAVHLLQHSRQARGQLRTGERGVRAEPLPCRFRAAPRARPELAFGVARAHQQREARFSAGREQQHRVGLLATGQVEEVGIDVVAQLGVTGTELGQRGQQQGIVGAELRQHARPTVGKRTGAHRSRTTHWRRTSMARLPR